MSAWRRTGGVLALLLVAGCANLPVGRGPRVSDEERAAYAATTRASSSETEAALAAFLESHPASALADDAAVRLAGMAARRGDTERAAMHYAWAVQYHPNGDRSDAARLALARIELTRGNRDAAAVRLRAIRLARLTDSERVAAHRLLVDAAGDPVERLRWLARVRADAADDDAVALVDVEIDQELLYLDRGALLSAADEIGRAVPAGRALVKAAELSLDADGIEDARRQLARASRLGVAPAYAARLAAVTERLRLREEGPVDPVALPSLADAASRFTHSTGGASGAIGVVLPLTGRFARFGEESLQGVLLASGIFDIGADGPRMRVLVRDSGGRPEAAARAVHELADAGVTAIVGPLLREECEAAARAAERREVPLITLTAREDVSARRPFVFRVRTRAEEEVQALVHHAIHNLGAQRFAILYPRDAYGRGLRRLFWEEVERRGGRIVGVAGYDSGATDFAKPIRRLVGYELLTDDEKQVLKTREEMERRARRLPPEEAIELRQEARELTGPDGAPLPPQVDYDALFIPESHDKVVLIAPQLAFHEANGATLLGPNGWHHADLVKIARKHVEGAHYTVHFHGGSEVAPVREFTGRFHTAYAHPPDVLAAQAFDAANLVLIQLARGRESREEVRDGVLDVASYPGVTGTLSMSADGNARKRPFLLRVERGQILAVD
ncbi:MAG: penicillin-binding protein activator [Deltaproteobacteria bacterium]|nr:penicillin-binding protein activator [Deltaproteobacteria bacterium]MBW2359820.1 penicillin-binding protein activator [Deltaproteobacteria bacterium]